MVFHKCHAIERFASRPLALILRCGEEKILDFSCDSDSAGWTVHFEDFAQVRTPWHIQSLLMACLNSRVELRNNLRVQSWKFDHGNVSGIDTDAGRFNADRYIVAAGAWTDKLLQPFNLELGIHPVRGEMLLYKPKCPLLSSILFEGKRYLVPRLDGRILVGSTESPSAGFDKQTTTAARASLSQFAQEMMPALAETPIEHHWSGLRPGSKDGVPTIDFVPGHHNVIVAAGHYRAGIQQSLGTAEIVAAMLNEEPSPIPREPFAINRPAPTHEPLFQS